MSDVPEIEDGGDGDVLPAEAAIGAAVATGAAIGCLSCAAQIVGPYCANCGQKNDDMRRSLFVLFKDFVADTFSFDSRCDGGVRRLFRRRAEAGLPSRLDQDDPLVGFHRPFLRCRADERRRRDHSEPDLADGGVSVKNFRQNVAKTGR